MFWHYDNYDDGRKSGYVTSPIFNWSRTLAPGPLVDGLVVDRQRQIQIQGDHCRRVLAFEDPDLALRHRTAD